MCDIYIYTCVIYIQFTHDIYTPVIYTLHLCDIETCVIYRVPTVLSINDSALCMWIKVSTFFVTFMKLLYSIIYFQTCFNFCFYIIFLYTWTNIYHFIIYIYCIINIILCMFTPVCCWVGAFLQYSMYKRKQEVVLSNSNKVLIIL